MLKKGLSLVITIMLIFAGTGFTLAAEPIRVGAPLCLTGPYAGDGLGYLRGIQMAVDELNAAGGVLGRPLELYKFDTQDFAPERVMQAADKLVGNDKVDVIHAAWAGWGQDVRAYGKYDVPTFVWDASINSVSVFREDPKQYSNWFQLNGVEVDIGVDTVKIMADLPFKYANKKIAVISTDDSWGLEIAAGIKKAAKATGDWKVVIEEVVPYGTREWGAILTKIRAAKPAWIHLEIVSSPDLITFFRQFMQAPTNSLINMGYGLTLPDFISNLGAEGDGLFGETITIPDPPPTPEAAAWIERFQKKFEAPPAAGSFVVYTGVMMWAAAVEAVGDPGKHAAVNQHLATKKYMTLEGREIYFNKDHYMPISVWPTNHMQIQDGKLETLYLNAGNPHHPNKFITPRWIK